MKAFTILAVLSALLTATLARKSAGNPLTSDKSDEVEIGGCTAECLNKTYWKAGCPSAEHWGCLCRSDGRLAFEVRQCLRSECNNDRDRGTVRGIQLMHCYPYRRQNQPAEAKPKKKKLLPDEPPLKSENPAGMGGTAPPKQ